MQTPTISLVLSPFLFVFSIYFPADSFQTYMMDSMYLFCAKKRDSSNWKKNGSDQN